MPRTIPINKGKYFAIVDDEDYEKVIAYDWTCFKSPWTKYAEKRLNINERTRPHLFMHRLIMNPPTDKVIDHINGNGLDNRKSNLRICTRSENRKNSKIYSNNKTGYKGVFWNTKHQKYQASISIKSYGKYIGLFDNPIEAAKAYNLAAKKYYGKFARLNVIPI